MEVCDSRHEQAKPQWRTLNPFLAKSSQRSYIIIDFSSGPRINPCSYLVVIKRNTKNVSKEEDYFGFGVVGFRSGDVAVYTTDLFDLPCRTLLQLRSYNGN
jgi:hypothetical protein